VNDHAIALRIIAYAFAASPWLACRGCFWWLRGKRLRGRRLICLAASRGAGYYRLWIRTAERDRIDTYLDRLELRPQTDQSVQRDWLAVVVLSDGVDDPQKVEATVRSADEARVRAFVVTNGQALGSCETCSPSILSDPGTLSAWLLNRGVSWFVLLFAGDLVSSALKEVLLVTVAQNPTASIIYWDEDRLDGQGRRESPWVKGAWDDLYFLVHNGLAGAAAYRTDGLSLLSGAFISSGSAADWESELAVRSVAATRELPEPHHVPLVLSHRGGCQALTDCWPDLVRRYWPEPQAVSRRDPDRPARLSLPTPELWPRISIVIPTRDRADLLRACVSGLEKTDYAGEMEVLIADNDSRDPETIQLFREFEARGIRIVPCPGPFNFAAMNNGAVQQSTGSVLCLLNNDVEMIRGDWLARMVAHAIRPRIGAVGALLLYPDRTVQHCGVAIGVGGAAGHVYRGIGVDEEGNGFTHLCTRRVSAVTAACLVISRSAFDAVGGFDTETFAVAFNDVDLCLRLIKAGFTNVVVTEAELIHHESKSRGDDMSRINKGRYLRELASLKARWHTDTLADPFHSPLLWRESEEFILAL